MQGYAKYGGLVKKLGFLFVTRISSRGQGEKSSTVFASAFISKICVLNDRKVALLILE